MRAAGLLGSSPTLKQGARCGRAWLQEPQGAVLGIKRQLKALSQKGGVEIRVMPEEEKGRDSPTPGLRRSPCIHQVTLWPRFCPVHLTTDSPRGCWPSCFHLGEIPFGTGEHSH